MSEAENVVNEPEVQREFTHEEKQIHVKNNLLKTLHAIYGQLINFIHQTPFDMKLKEFAVMNLDQGQYWVSEGIKAMQFSIEKPAEPAEPANQPPTEGETQC